MKQFSLKLRRQTNAPKTSNTTYFIAEQLTINLGQSMTNGISTMQLGMVFFRLQALDCRGPRPSGRSKRTWTEVVKKDCQACKLNKEDAMDHSKWRKLIKDV